MADAGDDDGAQAHRTRRERGVQSAVACAVLIRRECGECFHLRVREQASYARCHADASASSGFERHEHAYPHTVESSPDLARLAAHHRPYYERLYAQRLDVTPWERMADS